MDKELYVRQVFEINRLEKSADRIIEQVLDAPEGQRKQLMSEYNARRIKQISEEQRLLRLQNRAEEINAQNGDLFW